MVIRKIKYLLLPSFWLLMAAHCGCGSGEDGQPAVGIKSRSLGTDDVFTITPLKKVYKVGDKIRVKMVANVVAGLVDSHSSQGKFTGKKVNLYYIGAKFRFRSFITATNPNIGILYDTHTHTHTPNSYYPDKKQFIYEYDGVFKRPGKFHLEQGDLKLVGKGEKIDCDYYYHLHVVNFEEMKFEVVE